MKKCINCGREIPDDAVFCGFCGTRQPVTENKEDPEKETSSVSSEENHDVTEAETSEEVNTSEKDETKEDETGSVTEDDATDEETPETSDSEQETVSETEVVNTPEPEKSDKSDDADIKEAEIVEPAEEKDSEEENNASDETEDTETADDSESDHAENVDDSESEEKESESNDPESVNEEKSSSEKKVHKPHIQMKKIELPKINLSREDFNVLIDIVENPVEHHGITNATTWIILIFAWIANWVAFGSFSAGFFTLLIVLIGLIFLNWLTLKDHATFGETVRNSAEVLFTPSLLVFAGGLFIRNIRAGAEVFAFHSIFTTAFIGLFFLTAALILFLYIVIRKYEMKVWQIVLILTIFTSLLFWYLMTGGAIALIS